MTYKLQIVLISKLVFDTSFAYPKTIAFVDMDLKSEMVGGQQEQCTHPPNFVIRISQGFHHV